MWGLTKIGERVVISPYEITPSVLAHPLLPVPKMQPFLVNLAETTTTTAAGVWPANIGPMGSPKLLNPYEIAQALKRSAASDMASATKALTAHNKRKQPASEVIRRAFGELRAAVAARAEAEAEAKLAVRTEALATKRGIRERQQAGAEKAAAKSHLAETGKRVEAALDSPAFTSQEGREALEAERELIELRAMLTKTQRAAREAQRRLLPVSVFVSRMESKVYVRQGLAPVLETPISIRDPETPLGTHVYIATSADGASLRWSVVSFPVLSKSAGQTNGGRQRGTREAAGRAPAPSNAAQALERIDLPPNVSAVVSERLWTGGSLIISDQPLSHETSDVGTDLVVSVRSTTGPYGAALSPKADIHSGTSHHVAAAMGVNGHSQHSVTPAHHAAAVADREIPPGIVTELARFDRLREGYATLQFPR